MSGITGQYFRQFGLTVAAGGVHLAAGGAADHAGAGGLCAQAGSDRSPAIMRDGPIMTLYLHGAALVRGRIAGRRSPAAVCSSRCRSLASGRDSAVFRAARGFREFCSSPSSCPPAARSRIRRACPPRRLRCSANRPQVTDVIEFVGTDDGEIRNADLYISLVPRAERTHEPEAMGAEHGPGAARGCRTGTELFQSQGGGGDRDIQFYLTGDDPPLVETDRPHPSSPRCSALGEIRAAAHTRRPAAPRNRGAAAARRGRAARRERAEHQPDHPHRDAGRSAAERCQVRAGRPPDTDPREPGRKRAPGPRHARESAGAHCIGGRRAA